MSLSCTKPLGAGVTARIALALTLALASAGSSSAQSGDSTHANAPRLIGVYDAKSGVPLAGVEVRDAFTGTSAMTSVTGTARIDFLVYKGGAAIVELRKIGFEAKQIVVSRADTASVTELLEPATSLAPVVTTEKYQITRDAGKWDGFAMRCREKLVTCFGPAALEERPVASIAYFLNHAQGITIGSCGGGSGKWRANRNGLCGSIAMRPTTIPPAFCLPAFFIDGYEWDSSIGLPIDTSPNSPPNGVFTAANVKAIEVYPPEKPRPLRFIGRDPTCGAVVLWTK